MVEAVNLFGVWAAALLWLVFSAYGAWDAQREYAADRDEIRLADTCDERRVTRYRLKRARWFRAGFALAVIAAVLAVGLTVAQYGFGKWTPPDITAAALTGTIRYLLVAMLFCFWRAKRSDVALRRSFEGGR